MATGHEEKEGTSVLAQGTAPARRSAPLNRASWRRPVFSLLLLWLFFSVPAGDTGPYAQGTPPGSASIASPEAPEDRKKQMIGKSPEALHPTEPPPPDPCRIVPSRPQDCSDQSIVDSLRTIKAAVERLGDFADELHSSYIAGQQSEQKGRAGGAPQGRQDRITFEVDSLLKQIDRLKDLITRFNDLRSKNPEQDGVTGGKFVFFFVPYIVGLSYWTSKLITRFMRRVYGERGNLFQNSGRHGFMQSLLSCADQVSEEARHYSRLRFVIYTIFLAIFAGLGTLYFSEQYQKYQTPVKPFHDIIPLIGIVITIVFAALEFAVDWIETHYWYMAVAIREENIIRYRFNPWRTWSLTIRGFTSPPDWVRMPIWTIFYLSASLWFLAYWPSQVVEKLTTEPSWEQLPNYLLLGLVALLAVGVPLAFLWFLSRSQNHDNIRQRVRERLVPP